jgi:hypothetical protein
MNADDTRFDRLVDDEMNEEERWQLLGQLDDEPGGWRRCALAFLEAQCWKQSLGRLFEASASRSEGVSPASDGEGKTPPWGHAGETPALRETGETPAPPMIGPRRSPWMGRLRLVSAMAASFLVALWLGSVAHRTWLGHPGDPGTMGPIAKKLDVPHGVPSLGQPESRLAVAAPRSEDASNPWRLVTVSAPSDGNRPRPLMNVPAIERNNVDEQWLRSMPAAIPDDVLRALARTGHQVQQRREVLPVPLNDGRHLMVPVDQVDVHYTGNGAF